MTITNIADLRVLRVCLAKVTVAGTESGAGASAGEEIIKKNYFYKLR